MSVRQIDSPVQRAFNSGDEARLLSALQEAGELQSAGRDQSDDIIRVLRETASNSVRNAAAVALADIGAQEAADAILGLLARPDMARSGGSLLYALDELDVDISLSVLVMVVRSGSYEARSEALGFVAEGRIRPFTPQEASQGREMLERSLASDDPDEVKAAREILAYLNAPRSG